MKTDYNFNFTGFIITLIYVVIMYQVTIKTQNLYMVSVMVLGGVLIQFIFNRFIKFDIFNKKGKKNEN